MMIDLEFRLLNDFQRNFPLLSRPYAVMAERLGISEADVLTMLKQFKACGMISRVGPVFRPNSIGASTLAAMAVPPEHLDEVAQLVNTYIEVNHNYERQHRFNLWFVVTASDEARVQAVLSEINCHTGYEVLNLPLLEDFHIDLGFDLSKSRIKGGHKTLIPNACLRTPNDDTINPAHKLPKRLETALVSVIQQGLPLSPCPFTEIGEKIGATEEVVILAIRHLIQRKIIKRMGVIVRHLELGYRANAMVVWDIPDDEVGKIGRLLGGIDYVTLCYRRPRRLPVWRYNLFTMIHGEYRSQVLRHLQQLRQRYDLEHIAHEVLFSCRRFKQRGARYVMGTTPKWRTAAALAG